MNNNKSSVKGDLLNNFKKDLLSNCNNNNACSDNNIKIQISYKKTNNLINFNKIKIQNFKKNRLIKF